MPRDYRNLHPTAHQRLPEYSRDDAWIRAYLRTAILGHVGHQAGGQPFITPTNFWYDETNHCIAFHSNVAGRLRWNLERSPRVCFVSSEYGRALPSNAALEVSFQYRSVMAFGALAIVEPVEAKRRVMYGMLAKYFPDMQAGREYRPITDQELARTTVYEMHIEEWSGKENWKERADQIDDWPALPAGLPGGIS